MKYDPTGTGAAPNDVLVRRGVLRESASRLARLASRAERGGAAVNGIDFGHGVSVSSPEANQALALDPDDAVGATRKDFEDAGFEVRYTPTVNDDDHHTIVFPKPVTPEVAARFDAVLGRA